MPKDETDELKYQIALTMAQDIGPVTARKLIKELGSARAVLKAPPESLMKIKGIGKVLSESFQSTLLMQKAEKEIEFMLRHSINALFYKDENYPSRLNECVDGPVLLYARGEKGLHAQKILSVVGTRRATSYGRNTCMEIIKGLSTMVSDLVIVSGLAYGIDVIAHRAALECGIPTVAALGHGLATLYPYSHRDTAKKISKQGALITDFHSGMGPERNNFIRRNRIIAGLADATLVVESAETGGALITAGMASSYDRDVLAVPGRVGDDRSKGCNRLIRNTVAALVESPEDIIHHLNWHEDNVAGMVQPGEVFTFTQKERQVLDLILQHHGIDPGLLSSMSGISIQEVLVLLLEMELKQWVSVGPGNQYSSRIQIS